MTQLLQTLIDKTDTFEQVRDQIALILRNEVVNQMNLATAASKDPAEWDVRIFTERANPWEMYRDVSGSSGSGDARPIANVWFESFSLDAKASNNSEQQANTATYNIDLYGYGISQNIEGGGHEPGDADSAFEVQKVLRLVRNIVMSSINTYLQLQGLVWSRQITNATVFQPDLDNRIAEHVTGARIALRVKYNEFAPQFTGEELEIFSAEVKRSDTGEVLATVEYDYTT